MTIRSEPVIIQGGMGAAVSSWQLAKAVSMTQQLGVVSGTALDVVLARRLQLGDPEGDLRRALSAFPIPAMAQQFVDRFFIEGGKSVGSPFRAIKMPSEAPDAMSVELLVVASFVEVYLAKEGHSGLVGVNFLQKIQLPTLPAIYGAMLAGVDYVLMGAGIPRTIPGILDDLQAGRAVELDLHVEGADRNDRFCTRFDPLTFFGGELPELTRPKFIAIVASGALGTMLARKATGRVDGFVIEGPTAGGHNAPPRGAMQRNRRGEPVYGTRDEVDLEVFRSLGRPFWLAGGYGTPQRVREALGAGAAGVQIGTPFAYCNESGLDAELRQRVLELSQRDELDVYTDADASPTGFPFKVVRLDDSISETADYEQRQRICDLGYLRHAYKKSDGTLGWRCPSEPINAYLKKEGTEEDTCGRKCVCNGLLANVGLGQSRRATGDEKPLVTSGDDARDLARFLKGDAAEGYQASDVVSYLLGDGCSSPPTRDDAAVEHHA